MAKLTKIEKVYNELSRGRVVTKSSALKRFGVADLASMVYELRNRGFDVQNTTKREAGRDVNAYTL